MVGEGFRNFPFRGLFYSSLALAVGLGAVNDFYMVEKSRPLIEIDAGERYFRIMDYSIGSKGEVGEISRSD